MKPYSENDHAEALLIILESPQICTRCPRDEYIDKYYSGFWGEAFNYSYEDRSEWKYQACELCRSFLGTKLNGCPCYALKANAIHLTWITLEEKGYI